MIGSFQRLVRFSFSGHRKGYAPRQSRNAKIDSVAAQRDAFLTKKCDLLSPLCDAAVSAHDTMPWNVTFRGRENMADETRRVRIDVAIRLDEALGNCANELEDARGARLDR